MAISKEQIKSLARLSRLAFSEEEIDSFSAEFGEIINFADEINGNVEGDTASIREVVFRTDEWKELREDEVKESLPNEKITSNVSSDNGYFSVRRVVK